MIDEEGESSFQWEQDDDGNAIAFNQSDMMLKNKFSINAPFTAFKYVAINPNINISSDFVNRFQEASINEENEVELNTIDRFKNRLLQIWLINIYQSVRHSTI